MSSRKYSSDLRAEAARATRLRILRAAEVELRDVGYHAMTIATLARRAEVSPQTIYNALGSKAAVVKALYDLLLAGDDEPVPMSDRPEFAAVAEQPDGPATVRAYLALGRQLYDRLGGLLGILLVDGPGADPELRSFVDTIERERRAGNESVTRHLVATFGLPPGCGSERAADVLRTVTSYDVADRLIRRCGWTLDEYETWAGDVAVMSIWPEAAPGQ